MLLEKVFFKSNARTAYYRLLAGQNPQLFERYTVLAIKLNSTGGEGMESQQMSAGAMIGLAIILGALIVLFPGLVLWFAWLGVILLFIGGILALFMK